MLSTTVKLVLTAALTVGAAMSAFAVEIIHYDNTPQSIELLLGKERTIQFGDHVAVGTTPSQQSLFRVQSAQGALHIKPYGTFSEERITVKRLSDGRIYLLDLTAKEPSSAGDTLENVTIYMPDENVVAADGLPGGPGFDTQKQPSPYDITPIELTRYAAHKFYAPQRLHERKIGITAQPLGDLSEKRLKIFKGMSAAHTAVTAVTSYRAGPYHLAALLVANEGNSPITLEYLDLNVNFDYATFQHHRLAAAGQAGDRTMLYLISSRPAREFLLPWDHFSVVAEEVANEQ